MKTYQIGETAVIKATIKKASVLYSPATVKIYIYDSANVVKVDNVTVTAESPGVFPYELDTTAYSAGKYRVKYKGTDGAKISIKGSVFTLEA